MSESSFILEIKSTIDKLGTTVALAQNPPALFVDLDDSTATEEVMSSQAPAIIWEMVMCEESPGDPLYTVVFDIGARTTNDAANYDILALVGQIKEIFGIGHTIDICDYSGQVASAPTGKMTVLSNSVNRQAFDRTSGVRLVTVRARVQRWL